MDENDLDIAQMLIVGIYLSIVAVAIIFFLALAITQPQPVRHNICTIAEISPDITPRERERCRMIRGHKL